MTSSLILASLAVSLDCFSAPGKCEPWSAMCSLTFSDDLPIQIDAWNIADWDMAMMVYRASGFRTAEGTACYHYLVFHNTRRNLFSDLSLKVRPCFLDEAECEEYRKEEEYCRREGIREALASAAYETRFYE